MEKTSADILWIIVASALVFIMRAGFAMLEMGLVRSKNSINVATAVLTDLGISVMAFWPLGFGLMFGASAFGLFGTSNFLPDLSSPWITVFFLFHLMFASTAATIVSGAVSERIRFSAYIVVTFLFTSLLYPLVGHWVWGGSLEGGSTGWLGKLGFLDFAGDTVVHSVGGWISLAIIIILGPRANRYNKDGSVNRITGSNVQISVIGAILLWFGWIGFNGGSTLALNSDVPSIIIKTTLAGAAGMVVTLFLGWRMRKYADVSLVVNGAIAGLVAVTGSVAYVNTWQAVVIGAIGGLVMLFLEWFLDKRKLDDPVTAIPVHLGAGIWGTLAVGIFGNPELMKTGLSWGQQILVQLLGIVATGVFAFGVSYLAIRIFNHFRPIRVSAAEEALGLNVVEHKASTELYDLYQTLEEQSKSGDLSLRAPVEAFTEVGQIAERYNTVLDSLQQNLVAKSEYMNILDNVSDGLFLIDRNGKIGPSYAHITEHILAETSLGGKSMLELLKRRMPQASWDALDEFLKLMFDTNASARTLLQLNPLAEAELNIDSGNGGFETRYVQFFFKRIVKDRHVDSLMVIVRDVSEQKRMALQMRESRESQRSEMELFSRIIQVEPALLAEFMENFESSLEAINEALESDSHDYRGILDTIFRSVHLLKGEADTLGLDFIAELADALEERIVEIRTLPKIEAEDFLSLSIQFRALQDLRDRLSGLLARVAAFQDIFSSDRRNKGGAIVSSLSRLAKRLELRHAKGLDLDAVGFPEDRIPQILRKPIRDILIQFVRNSAVHGIEPASVRKQRGKPERGKLAISLARDSKNLAIVYSDDGAGFDLEAIRRRAVEMGIYRAESAADIPARDLIPLLFRPGFSTAAEQSMSAGRGVGLDAIRDLVRRAGGRITIKNKPGAYCEFTLIFPLAEVAA